MAVRRRQSTKDARALAFSATVFVSLFLIIAVRSRWRQLVAHRPPSPALWWIGGGASFMLALVFFVPLLRDLFKFGLRHTYDLAIAAGTAWGASPSRSARSDRPC